MRKVFFFFCCMILITSYPSFAEKINGYGKTHWGMTPDQVLVVEDGRAHRLNPPETYGNSLGLVGIDRIKIASKDFKVVYQFVGNKLNQVLLQTLEDKNILINRDTFQSVEQLLTQKYGQPKFKEPGKSVVWEIPGTTIELSHFYIQDVVTLVSVHYSSDAETSKMTEDL